jgi:hypothetical protein
MLLQRMFSRAREMAEALSCDLSNRNNSAAAVATAAYMSHVARVHLLVLPHLPTPRHQEPDMPREMALHRSARAGSFEGRFAVMADDEEGHLAKFSGAAGRHDHENPRHHYRHHHHQQQHQQQQQHFENCLHLTWMNVWRSCR